MLYIWFARIARFDPSLSSVIEHTRAILKTYSCTFPGPFLSRMIPFRFQDSRYDDEQDNWAVSRQNQQTDCAPSEDSDQPGHPPSLIRVFAVRLKKHWVLSCPLRAQWRLWSDWADARLNTQADPSRCWAHSHFVDFAMKRLNYYDDDQDILLTIVKTIVRVV